jgi:hypothetical protein
MIKNKVSVEKRLVELACRRNEILRGSVPTTNLMVIM